jgi:hypothetical protein
VRSSTKSGANIADLIGGDAGGVGGVNGIWLIENAGRLKSTESGGEADASLAAAKEFVGLATTLIVGTVVGFTVLISSLAFREEDLGVAREAESDFLRELLGFAPDDCSAAVSKVGALTGLGRTEIQTRRSAKDSREAQATNVRIGNGLSSRRSMMMFDLLETSKAGASKLRLTNCFPSKTARSAGTKSSLTDSFWT